MDRVDRFFGLAKSALIIVNVVFEPGSGTKPYSLLTPCYSYLRPGLLNLPNLSPRFPICGLLRSEDMIRNVARPGPSPRISYFDIPYFSTRTLSVLGGKGGLQVFQRHNSRLLTLKVAVLLWGNIKLGPTRRVWRDPCSRSPAGE